MLDVNGLGTGDAGELAQLLEERFYRVEEVARWLQVSPRTVHNAVIAGTLPSRHIGRLVRIPLSGLRAWLAGQEG